MTNMIMNCSPMALCLGIIAFMGIYILALDLAQNGHHGHQEEEEDF